MKLRLIEKEVESISITTARNSPTIDVGSAGGDSIAFVMVSTNASTPNTATIQLFGSLDGTSFIAIGSTVSVTTNAVHALTQDRPPYRYYRVQYAIASGSYTSTLKVLVKGDLD